MQPITPNDRDGWIDRNTYRLPDTEYINQRVPKDLIVLHATASSTAGSVFGSWTSPGSGRVATAYVVERDGRVYEFFPPDRWAFHLGMKERNLGSYNDRRSIGIEIVNVGPLRPDPDGGETLNWWPNQFRQPWCRVEERGRYVEAEFRGFKYFAAFTAEQREAVRRLVEMLEGEFGIPRSLPPAAKRNSYDPAFFCKFKGVASHQNFRPDKLDVGPAWDWAALVGAGSRSDEQAA